MRCSEIITMNLADSIQNPKSNTTRRKKKDWFTWHRLSLAEQHLAMIQCTTVCCQTLMFHIHLDRMQCSEMQVQSVPHAVQCPMQFPIIANRIDFYPKQCANNPKSVDNSDRPMSSSNVLLLVCHWQKRKKRTRENLTKKKTHTKQSSHIHRYCQQNKTHTHTHINFPWN